MKIDAKKLPALIAGWITAALIVTLGVVLMLSCWGIYKGAPSSPYSPEIIAQRFHRISFVVYLTLAAILFSGMLCIILPEENKRPKAIRDDKIMMLKAKQKAGAPLSDGILKEQNKRILVRVGTAVIFALLMLYPAIYFIKTSHFTVENQNADIAKAITLTLIPAVVGLILCYCCWLLIRKSYQKETALYKELAASSTAQASLPVAFKGKKLFLIRCAIFTIAAVFIVVGIFNGGADDVLLKAIVICTECIGLG